MLYTLTANPSIDYLMQGDEILIGEVNKINKTAMIPGGKGINVARIINELDEPTKATGFLGGFTGDYIKQELVKKKINADFIKINDNSRINVKLKFGEETEINAPGPNISAIELGALLNKVQEVKKGDILAISGSTPLGLPNGFYRQIVELITQNKADFIVDTTGEKLLELLPFKPLMVKPNVEELGSLFQQKISSEDQLIRSGEKLLNLGAQNVVVSMAGDGAYLFTGANIYRGFSPKGIVKNSVGAGDSLVGGFMAGYAKNGDIVEAFKLGMACGSATAFSFDLGTSEEIKNLIDKVEVKKIK